MRGRARLLVSVVLVAALVDSGVFAWMALWSHAADPGAFFGGDHESYRQAAIRLASTGSPYHPLLFAGPIANDVKNVPIAYLYPPPLAQLFVPLLGIPAFTLAAWSSAVQGLIVAIVFPLVYRRFAFNLAWSSVLGVWLIAGVSNPVHFAIYGGNLSGWIAISIAIALVAPRRAGPVVATLMGIVKMTPGILLVPALLTRTARLPVAAVGLLVVGTSVAISPFAWAEWLRALPNIFQFPPWDGAENFSPVVITSAIGLPQVGSVLTLLISATAIVGAVVLARSGRWYGSIAAAATALLFATSSVGSHYLAILTPLVIAALPNSSRTARVALTAFIITTIVPWFAPEPSLVLRALYLFAALAACITVTIQLARYPTGEPTRSRVTSRGLVVDTGRAELA